MTGKFINYYCLIILNVFERLFLRTAKYTPAGRFSIGSITRFSITVYDLAETTTPTAL